MVGGEPAPSGAGAVLGKYKLVRLIGEGGMGSVFEAVHQDLGRRAAVKTLHPRFSSSQEVRQRFLREGQSAARIRHPNVADVYDVGNEGDQPYLVMEYLEGEDLGRLLGREGKLPVERAVDLLLPVVAAVAAAHDLGVVHRDLKPDNIFLCWERSSIKPKVLDFGISKLTNDEEAKALTGTGAMLGTPYYMSPEQAQGSRHVDFRSDHYALGVILYECVTGHRPIEEPSLYSLIRRIVAGDFAPPRQVEPSLPLAFEEVVLRALAQEPGGRFATTRELGAALLPFASEPIQLQFAPEFEAEAAHAKTVSSMPGPLDPQKSAPGGSTTLGESAVHQSDVRIRTRPDRRWLALGLVVTAGGGLLFWQGLPSVPASSPAAPSAALGDVRAASPALQAEALPAAPLEPPGPATPTPSKKRVLSDPAGAEVWSGDQKLGTTPVEVEVPPGTSLDLELRLAGHSPRMRVIGDGDGEEVTVELSKEPRPARPAAARSGPSGRPSLAPR